MDRHPRIPFARVDDHMRVCSADMMIFMCARGISAFRWAQMEVASHNASMDCIALSGWNHSSFAWVLKDNACAGQKSASIQALHRWRDPAMRARLGW